MSPRSNAANPARTRSTFSCDIDQSYVPAGTAVPHGVEIIGLGPIGVSITATLYGEGLPRDSWGTLG
jgi:hypothetical protein